MGKAYLEDIQMDEIDIFYNGAKIGLPMFISDWKSGAVDLRQVRLVLNSIDVKVLEIGFNRKRAGYIFEITDLRDYILLVENEDIFLYKANCVATIDGFRIISDGMHYAAIVLNSMSEFIYSDVSPTMAKDFIQKFKLDEEENNVTISQSIMA